MKNGRTTMIKRFFALVLAFAVAVSILTVPVQESYAAGGKVKTVAVTNLPAKQLTLKKGKSFTLKTKVSVSGKKVSKAVTYKTSNKKVATVNAKGKITAKKNGKAVITVISKANKKKTVKIKVTVGTPVTKVKLNKTKANLNVGKSLTLKATVTPKKATNKKVKWTIRKSDKKYASINSKGVLTVKKAAKGKTIKVTATAVGNSKVKATYTVKVMKKAVKKVTITSKKKTVKKVTIKKKQSVTLKANLTPTKGISKEVTWISGNPKIAKVTAKGKVTGKKKGTVKITAKAKDGSGKKATITLKVK